MAYKTSKNLLQGRDTYNKYYGDFRGVDFSSDHTQVNEQRLAYAVNMYRDYQSGQGQAIETIPGFRKRVILPEEDNVNGIFHFSHKDENGNTLTKVLIHSGNKLYLWNNYPNTVNVVLNETITVPAPTSTINGTHQFEQNLSQNVAAVVALTKPNGEDLTLLTNYNANTRVLSYASSGLSEGDELILSYKEGVINTQDALFSDMNNRRSASFIFNNKLYVIDGKNYLVYDGNTLTNVLDNAYIPTTYINIVPDGVNADIGSELEQRNMLQPKFKHTFIADGTVKKFILNENQLDEISEVKVYGVVMSLGADYTVDLANGSITFETAPGKPEETVQVAGVNGAENVYYPEFYAGVEITAKKHFTSVSGVTNEISNISDLITDCTIAAVYDNRVFFSGNPAYPNYIFYCERNNTGFVDPTYFGILNYMQDGVGIAPITGMITVADTLMVLKNDTQQDGSTYFHTATSTGTNIQPKIYPSSQGLSGIGCLGACVNFLDDPIFISRLGVEAVGQLSVRNERANEHRSSLIDAKITNMNLESAIVEEWNGYLILLVDGNIFMADSRQKYVHPIGVPQYEWYYIEGVGVYKGQYLEYYYSNTIPDELVEAKIHYCTACKTTIDKCTCGNENHHIELSLEIADSVYLYDSNEVKDLRGVVINAADDNGLATDTVLNEYVSIQIDEMNYTMAVNFKVHEIKDIDTGLVVGYKAYICETKGNNIGGTFKKAVTIKNMEENIFFGTENGVVCSFNFDKRESYGEIPLQYYTFDDRTIYCGCATKMDCCGIPHLTKNTVKKSTVIKTKTFKSSAAKIKVRTNRKAYEQIARINSSSFSFEDMDFSNFTFNTTDQNLFAIKEKEKQWVEKQYYIYSDEFMKPIALYYISFRYQVCGRYKN
ncbi:MAG: hypothetical protein E7345_01355 [Clostridiales bacterium]|nr:hypothetical protein [Clostridiales bacterium]